MLFMNDDGMQHAGKSSQLLFVKRKIATMVEFWWNQIVLISKKGLWTMNDKSYKMYEKENHVEYEVVWDSWL